MIPTCKDVNKSKSSAVGKCLDTSRSSTNESYYSFVVLCHHCCSKVKVSSSSIKAAFMSKGDSIFNNANVWATDWLAVLVDLMGWAVLICEPGFYLLDAQKFSRLLTYIRFHGLNLQR